MKKINTEKYIEIPFKDRGRDHTGCDCWGLVRLVYKEEYGIALPSFLDVYTNSSEGKRVAEAIKSNKPLINYTQHETPKYGDVVIMNVKGSPCHVGIYVGKNMVLHVLKGSDSTCERLSSAKLKGRVEGFYEISGHS